MKKSLQKAFGLLLGVILFQCTFSVTSVAQSADIKWHANPSRFGKYFLQDAVLLKEDGNFIYYKFRSSIIRLQDGALLNEGDWGIAKYDLKKDTTYTLVPELKQDDVHLNFLTMHVSDSCVKVFSSFHNRKVKKLFLFCESYSLNTLKSNNDIKKFAEIDLSVHGGFFTDYNLFILAQNDRFMLRYSCNTTKGEFFGLEVFDKNLNSESSTGEFAMPDGGKYIYETGYVIDKKGNVYATQQTYNSKKEVRSEYPTGLTFVVCYPNTGQTPITMPLELEGKAFVSDIKLAVNDRNELICAGFYGKPKTTTARGCYAFLIEPLLGSVLTTNFKEMSMELLTKGEVPQIAKAITKMDDFDKQWYYTFDSIRFRNNGDFDLVMQKHRGEVLINKNGGRTYTFYYDDIYFCNFKASGNVNWIQKIPLTCEVTNAANLQGKYCVVYDKKGNANVIFNLLDEKGGLLMLKTQRLGSTVLIRYDVDGNESFKSLFGDEKTQNSICPQIALPKSDGTVILCRYPYLQDYGLMKTNNMLEFGELDLNL